MEVYHLFSLKVVAEQKHLTRAAKKIFIGQSALRAQIIALENEMGAKLFHRASRGMDVTPEGKTALAEAHKTLNLAAELKGNIKIKEGPKCRTLKPGLQTDLAFLRINDFNEALQRKIENLDLNYISTRSGQTCELLIKRKIDIGFLYGQISDKRVDATEIGSVATCLKEIWK